MLHTHIVQFTKYLLSSIVQVSTMQLYYIYRRRTEIPEEIDKNG